MDSPRQGRPWVVSLQPILEEHYYELHPPTQPTLMDRVRGWFHTVVQFIIVPPDAQTQPRNIVHPLETSSLQIS
jgi:hypothetical protein